MKYSISLSMLIISMLVVGAEDPNLPPQNKEKSTDASLNGLNLSALEESGVVGLVLTGAGYLVVPIPGVPETIGSLGSALYYQIRDKNKLTNTLNEAKCVLTDTQTDLVDSTIPPAAPFPIHPEGLPQSSMGLNHQWMSVAMRSPFDNSMRNYQFPLVRRRAASDPEKAIIDAVRGKRRGSVAALLEQGVEPQLLVVEEAPLIWIAVESYISANEGEDRANAKEIIQQLIESGCHLGCAVGTEESAQTILSRGVERWDAEDLSAFINDFYEIMSEDMLEHAGYRCMELFREGTSDEARAKMKLLDELLERHAAQHND